MNMIPPTASVVSDNMEDEIFADLALAFVHTPLYRFSVDASHQWIEPVMKHFADKVYRAYRWRDAEGVRWHEVLLRFDDTTFVHFYNYSSTQMRVYADSPERAEQVEAAVRAVVPPPTEEDLNKPFFYMIRRDDDDVETERVENTSPLTDDETARICYGEDFLDWINLLKTDTEAKAGGITILDGPPGTGKSTLIAQLMRRLCRSHVFYVLPVSEQEVLTAPNMVKFWKAENRRHPRLVKMVILEDAEKILLQRRSDNNEAVSALLNIADGLMGQMLRVHVLCTLNQGMEHLDPAIIRPGRLRSYRFVDFLSRASAVRLAQLHELEFVPDPARDQYTLAEVFHGNVYEKENRAATMGFHALRG